MYSPAGNLVVSITTLPSTTEYSLPLTFRTTAVLLCTVIVKSSPTKWLMTGSMLTVELCFKTFTVVELNPA